MSKLPAPAKRNRHWRASMAESPSPLPTEIHDHQQPDAAVLGETNSEYINTGKRFYLSGSGSYDPDGTIVSYTWVLNPGCQAVSAANKPTLIVETTLDGICKVSLKVTDAQGAYGVALLTASEVGGL